MSGPLQPLSDHPRPRCALGTGLRGLVADDPAGRLQDLDGRQPSIGTASISVPYLDSERARIADVPVGTVPGLSVLNYTPDQFLSLVSEFAGRDTQIATHINGDAGIDVVLDGYEQALGRLGLSGTDHRWRVEHFATPSREQCARAGALGVTASMSPFQSLYWGPVRRGDLRAGLRSPLAALPRRLRRRVRPTFHNDGYLSPPLPWLNIQNAVTRRSASGTVHAPEQALTSTRPLAAHTINAAWQQKRDHEIGSIEPGKLADPSCSTPTLHRRPGPAAGDHGGHRHLVRRPAGGPRGVHGIGAGSLPPLRSGTAGRFATTPVLTAGGPDLALCS